MATTFESTTTRRSRMLSGCPCATAAPGRLREEPTQELLYDRSDWPAPLAPAPATSLPLPPVNAVVEALDDLALGADDPSIYHLARTQIAAGVWVAFDGETRWVDGVQVGMAPEGLRWPWPWCCACGHARCWHGALCDGLLLAEIRVADAAEAPGVAQEPDHRIPYTTLLLVCGVSVLILLLVPRPPAEWDGLHLGALGETVQALVVGR